METYPDKEIESGFEEARNLTRRHGRIFYFASLLLPRRKQDAACALYAFCMESDESVDSDCATEKRKRLSEIKEGLDAAYNGLPLKTGLLAAFRYTVQGLGIPRSYFEELLEGMRMDLEKSRYSNFQELSNYCYKVAGVIGLMMLRVFECHDTEAQKYAIDLGFAMQLTNIIRDVKEDWERGRVYLPQDEMERYGVEEKDIEHGIADYEFRRFIEFQAERARGYYNESLAGLNFIKEKRLRLVIASMHQMYSSILDEIERNGFDVFSRRPRVSEAKKAYIVLLSAIKEYL